MKPVASIIIPTFNHRVSLGEAIACSLAQTVPCEVIVVDDGSTDGTAERIHHIGQQRDDWRVNLIQQAHAGPSVARNAGIEAASGEFVMFLDADDVMEPQKVERQLAEFEAQPDAGFVLCDVLIDDAATGRKQLASDRYGYDDMELGGWIRPLLLQSNFIPVMSPLVRRSVLGSWLRFDETKAPEDWHFWCEVAAVARARYVPEVLATYRKGRTGRSRTSKTANTQKDVAPPLRLNLGCGTKGTRSWHPIAGMVNLDKSMGWRFEDGLGDFVSGSVSGITVSHALMYVDLEHWPKVFEEFARVLKPGGVLRVTEDDTKTPGSSRIGGWHGSEPAVALTDPAIMRKHLEAVGFTVFDVQHGASNFADLSLCQAQHGEPPDVFFIEGVRESTLLLSPHSDDEVLFAAFTIIRHRPRVVICCPSSGDYGDTATRFEESKRAVAMLGGATIEQWDGEDLVARMRSIDARLSPSRVWAPSAATSHPDHLKVAMAAREVFGDRLTCFHTYIDGEKVRDGEAVAFEQGWTTRKRDALQCYATQWDHPRARQFFRWDLPEYQE